MPLSAPLLALALTLTALFGAPATASDRPVVARQAAAPQVAVKKPTPPVNCRVQKCIALTYDDGPAPSTSQLLATLRAKKAVATFFVVGQQAAKYPAVLRSIAGAGHEIGVHTWDHANLTRLAPSTIASEISRTADVVRKTTGVRPTLLRPPYGATNANVESAARQAGMAEILWSIDPIDWRDRNSALVTQRVLAGARPGAIVLMHDIHPTTVAAAPAIIDGLRKRGYRLVTVTQLLGHPVAGQKYSSR